MRYDEITKYAATIPGFDVFGNQFIYVDGPTLTGQTGSETKEVEEVRGAVEQKPCEKELEPTNKKPGPSGTYRRTSRKNVSGKKAVADSVEDDILRLRKRKLELECSKLELEIKRLKKSLDAQSNSENSD